MRPPNMPVVLAIAALGASLAIAGSQFETGPLPSFTGTPAIADKFEEFNCSICHANFDWNNINTDGGGVEILGLPDSYEGGQLYPVSVRLHSDSTATFAGRRWGFQITAVSLMDGEGIGTFELPDPDTLQIVHDEFGGFASRRYVTHTAIGRRDSLEGGASWHFAWRAPEVSAGRVLFGCAAVAANGNSELYGDFVFTILDTLDDAATPARPVSWGSVKARYR